MENTHRAVRPVLPMIAFAVGVLALAILLAAPAARAAGGDILWSVPLAGAATDDAIAVPVGPSGSALLCGTLTPAGTESAVVIRESVAGLPDWVFAWGGDLTGGANVRASAYDARHQKLYLMATVRDPVHRWAFEVLQVDMAGSLVWTRTFSALSATGLEVQKAAVDAQGNLLVAGATFTSGATSTMGAFLVKFSAQGAIVWERSWWEGAWELGVSGLAVTPGGNACCTGTRFAEGGARRAFLRSFSPSGRMLWAKTFSGSTGDPMAYAVATAPHGGVVAVGRRNQAGVVKGVAEKYTSSGRLVWRRAVSTGSFGDGFLDVAVGRDGKVFASGASAFPDVAVAGPYVVALRPSGSVLWKSQWDHEGWGQQIAVSHAGVYVGAALASSGPADTEMLGAECPSAANGSTTWRRAYDAGAGANDAGFLDLSVVAGQSVYLAASIRDTVNSSDGLFLRVAP